MHRPSLRGFFLFFCLSKPLNDRSMTVFAEANVDVDLRMLRSFRVLRPLKLVSRIPSKGRNVALCFVTSFVRVAVDLDGARTSLMVVSCRGFQMFSFFSKLVGFQHIIVLLSFEGEIKVHKQHNNMLKQLCSVVVIGVKFRNFSLSIFSLKIDFKNSKI